MKKSLLFLMIAILFSIYANAQNAEIIWTLKSNTDGVKVYTSIVKCDNPNSDLSEVPDPLTLTDELFEVILIKIENTSSSDVSVSWNDTLIKNEEGARTETTVAAGSSYVLNDCENAPEIHLTKAEGDNKPVSVTEAEALLDFKIELIN